MKKLKFMRVSAALLILLTLTALFCPAAVLADTPYETYTMNGYGQVRRTQTAYLPYSTITKFGEEIVLSGPSDIVVTDDGYIYVADSGNARVVIGTLDGQLVSTVGEGILKNPKGIYVTGDKQLYVADRDSEAVFVFDADGKPINRYTKPTSPLYGDAMSFLPIKIVVNDAGIMFVVCESNTNGIVEISPTNGGTFLGYFGTNFASRDLMTIIYRAIMTDAQRAKTVSNIPSTPTNLAIDTKGLIYTVTRGDNETSLKRLNIAGTNLIKECEGYAETPIAVATGYHDNVYVADQQGFIYEYNSEGELLFVFGGADDGTQRVGLSSMVSGIAVDRNNRLYVLDSDKCRIQIYEPTEFTNLLHEALYLYSKGRYTESKEPLTKILEMNSMFDYANKAMGRAYFQEEDYSNALRYARLAKDYEGYSDAMWEIRNIWLKDNIMTVMLIAVLIFAVIKVIKVLDEKKGILDGLRAFGRRLGENRFLSDIGYSGYYTRHPVDGAYGILYEDRAGWAVPTLLLIVFTAEYVINKYTCGFLMKNVMEGRYEILSDIGTVFIAMAALTGCTYLVCTINKGEGTVKKIYTFFCYSLVPYIMLTPISYLLSHVITYNETVITSLLSVFIYGWIAVIAFIGLKEVNDFTVKETIKVILLTVFAILILALLVFILYVLWAQVFEFVSALIGEGAYRLGI